MISKETLLVIRMDWVLLKMRGKKRWWVENHRCDACEHMSRSCLTDGDNFVCADCYQLNSDGGTPLNEPKRVPQGDLLTRLPIHPRFTKRFK